MRLSAGTVLCLLLLTCCCHHRGLGARSHGCLFDLRLCSKEEVCVQDGLFGQCRDRSERDVGQFQVTPGTLQQLQAVLRRLTAKGLSWKDDVTQRVMAHEMGRIPQHKSLEPLDLLDEDRSSLPLSPGRSIQRLTGAGPLQRWSSRADTLQYFRPRVSSSDSSTLSQRLPGNFKQNISPLLDRYLTYSLLSLQSANPQPSYQDLTRARNPTHHAHFAATHTRPDGTRRLIYGRYEGGRDTPPLPLQVPSDIHQSWSELRRKLPRGSLDSLADDVSESSERIERMSQMNRMPDGDQNHQPESREEGGRTFRGSIGIQNTAEAQSAPEVSGLLDAQSLAGVLEKFGVDLKQLSESQLEQLSYLLQMLQLDAPQNQGRRGGDRSPPKRISEGDMQHSSGAQPPFPPPDIIPRDISPAPVALNADQRDEERVMSATPASITTHLAPDAQTLGEQQAHLLAAIRDDSQKSLEKKSYQETGETPDGSEKKPQEATEDYGYILTDQKPLSLYNGFRLLDFLAQSVHMSTSSFINISVAGSAVTFRIRKNRQNLTLTDITDHAMALKSDLQTATGIKIVQTGIGQRSNATGTTFPHASHFGDTFRFVLLIFIALACIAGIVIASAVIFCLRQHAKQREKERLAGLGPEGAGDSTFEYQDLCRQHMAGKSLFSRTEGAGAAAENSRVSSVSSQFSDVPQPSPSSHSSTPSWCEEPVQSNMDISTGHMILAYMEDHMRNRDRLAKEWQALGAYQAEPSTCSIAKNDTNLKKNRNPDFVPYDHARIKLRSDNNPSRSDYINASPIIEHDPRMPAYIATQGPLSHTIADFWQMVWENGCTVIVMLSPLVEDGVKQCDRYWPDEGSSLYHIYEVNLVSEHIWCEDFLVRSFYLKNVQTQETRTLTQFHFLSWPAEGIPSSTRPLLDFRRKVNKSFRGRSCPIIVHCSDGAGRTGTYILVDMVLSRMAKGVKEIDIAASLEHVRDQRPGMVRTKDQFEFALTAVAEEVNAILKALPQ
ncbi:receptor-type tyrosine-protein phosphatase-like N [Bufo gargarizans]|uniref:receptor-type tyrosine-protein phosphatase-like N n=1 Tax=Bufo gargarizans TaxID=30331 RepID=UPI001CF48A97|nr:receptor-type tyrosine-protein phosphatase-like N [Bufo gargarizans]